MLLAYRGSLGVRSLDEVVVSGLDLFGDVGVSTAALDSPKVFIELFRHFGDGFEVTWFDHDALIRSETFVAS